MRRQNPYITLSCLSPQARRILDRLGKSTDPAEAQRLSQLVLLLEMELVGEDRRELREPSPIDEVE